MEFDLERQERIAAPLQLVWEEVDSLEQLVSKSPQIRGEVVPGSDHAVLYANLQWGPLKWKIDGELRLVEVRPLEHIDLALTSVPLEIDGNEVIDLQRLSDTDTRLTFHAHVVCRHRFGGRMKGVLAEFVEGQMISVVGRTKSRAEQRQQARDRLLR